MLLVLNVQDFVVVLVDDVADEMLVACFNCGQHDHFQWQCPKAPVASVTSDAPDNSV